MREVSQEEFLARKARKRAHHARAVGNSKVAKEAAKNRQPNESRGHKNSGHLKGGKPLQVPISE